MKSYHNILYAMDPNNEAIEGLKQALSIARNNSAVLHLLLFYTELPDELLNQCTTFEAYLAQHMNKKLEEANTLIQNDQIDVTMEVMKIDVSPAIALIRYVMRNGHDLLIKEAEVMGKEERGFKALDMTLLRKCPTALYLAKPIAGSRDTIRVAVAVDPMSDDEEERDLNLRLLQLARAFADTCNGTLEIISYWDYEYERALRHNAWVKISDEDLSEILLNVHTKHRAALDNLIKESKITGEQRVHHLRGDASELLSEFAEREEVDIMVMGTIARSGIAGYFIGNTAENIFEKLHCSLFALKPSGFVSPIKSYD